MRVASRAQHRQDAGVRAEAEGRRGRASGTIPSRTGAASSAYVVCFGRMQPGGGIDRAIAIARAAGKRVAVVARAWEHSERRYFMDTIEPLLGADAVFLGEAGRDRRLELLTRAEAVLNAGRWNVDSVQVTAEALACGTPILTLADDAAAEMVEHGRTGYLCADDVDMAEKLASVWRTRVR